MDVGICSDGFLGRICVYQQGAAVEDDGRDDRAMEFLLRIQVPALLIGGFFTAPFVVLWTVYKFIRALRR